MSGEAPVSVIVAVRNGAAHLGGALDSVLGQVPAPAEVIVIDGDSSDDSVVIASAYPRVQVLRQRGRGLAGARNEGIGFCRSRYVAFCDADDRWTGNALTIRMAAIDRHPNIFAVIGRLSLERLDGTPVTAPQHSRLGVPLPGFTPGALLVRRALFGEIGLFDEALAIGADSDWFVRLRQSSFGVRILEDVVLRKGARATSLSTEVSQYRRELLAIGRRYIQSQRKAAK